MYLKIKSDIVIDEKQIDHCINTDNIIDYYPSLEDPQNSTCILMCNNRIVTVKKPVRILDSVFNATDISTIDDPGEINTTSQKIDIHDINNVRLATPKQVSYIKSLATKHNILLPDVITFDYARTFLNTYGPKRNRVIIRKPQRTLDFKEDCDEDADGEFPGYRD